MGAAGRLVLASGSPRRKELAKALDAPLEAITPVGEEPPPRDGETPEQFVLRLSLAKAREVAVLAGGGTVLAADTAVVAGGAIMGKPADREEATRMLRCLRGRSHRVVTGVTTLDSVSGRWMSATKCTKVVMRRYSDAEVEAYVASGEPFDKAGYAIQDETFRPVLAITGCYLNVVGLPLCEVVTLLARMRVPTGLVPGWRVPEQCVQCPLEKGREDNRA